ncbi:MAG: transketolase [Luteitalea sp.]|nr:transketolase [Luteitalea sp.]
MTTAVSLDVLQNIATRLRIDSVRATSEAGSGHPTTCCSAADIVAALFFADMQFDPKNPRRPDNDRFVLSKGHAAPLLYAVWAELGVIGRASLLKLRQIDSDLEGHPTPRLPFVDVATGSLGQGICAAVGMALNARRIGSTYRTYALLGDGESAEGSVWEAAQSAQFYALENLCAIVDVNKYGQSGQTQLGHDLESTAARWRGFGWHALVVDGHDLQALVEAYATARATQGRPTVILARTLKGKGISFVEGKDGWHGKPLKKNGEMERAIAELEQQLVDERGATRPVIPAPVNATSPPTPRTPPDVLVPAYSKGDKVATREAYGTALAKLGAADPRVVALDGDVKNSTFSEKFKEQFPDRFYEAFIAEQSMVGMAMGLASVGAIPFASTFGCFLTRAADFIRMAGISAVNVKLSGSHCGVSIGEDGPSQMALEDLALMRAVPDATVLYPCDAVSTERLTILAAQQPGIVYLRTTRPKTPVLYGADEPFTVGGSKVLRSGTKDQATVVGAGITVYEALAAFDELSKKGISIRVIDLYSIQPVDADALVAAGRETGRIITVEDHYAAGGLGDAVAEAVAPHAIPVQRLAVREIPRSGQADVLLDRYGISARHIVEAVVGATA